MNKKIFFALTLYAALNASENNHTPYTFLPLNNCQDLTWLQNGTILINASSKNTAISQETVQGIFSIDTNRKVLE